MEQTRRVVYLNWDGFARHIYDAAAAQGLVPVLESLKGQGVFFENARSGIPAITNPMQTAIASGAYAAKTGNVRLYYDRQRHVVVSQRRENRAENLAAAFSRQGKSVASVHHFSFEENGTYAGDARRPFVFLPHSGYEARFDALARLLTGEEVPSGGRLLRPARRSDFAAFYLDDLDTVGHNNGKLAPVARTLEERERFVLWRLAQLDAALGRFLERLREKDAYEGTAFFLITDHGMTPFLGNEASRAAYKDLIGLLKGCGYRFELLSAGMSPAPGTDLVLCSAGMSLMLTFTRTRPDAEIAALRELLEKKEYLGRVMTGHEIVRAGSMDFCDLYLSPRPPFILRSAAPAVGATHDSLDDTAQHIFSLMWGDGIKKGTVVRKRTPNIDFAPTMARLLGAEPPAECVGSCIDAALE